MTDMLSAGEGPPSGCINTQLELNDALRLPWPALHCLLLLEVFQNLVLLSLSLHYIVAKTAVTAFLTASH